MVPKMAEVTSAKSSAIDRNRMEVRGRVGHRIDMIAMRHAVDVRCGMGNDDASRVNPPVSCMRYQVPMRGRVRHRIYVIPVREVIDVRGCMRYRIVMCLTEEYLSRSRLDNAEYSECDQNQESVSHNSAPS